MGGCFSSHQRGSVPSQKTQPNNDKPQVRYRPLPPLPAKRFEARTDEDFNFRKGEHLQTKAEPWFFGNIKTLEAEKQLALCKPRVQVKKPVTTNKHLRQSVTRSGSKVRRSILQDIPVNKEIEISTPKRPKTRKTHVKHLTASASKKLDSGAKNSCSPLEKARANLHLHAAPKHLLCREVEYKSMHCFLVRKINDKLTGRCCLLEQFFLRVLGAVTTRTGIEHSTIDEVYTELKRIFFFTGKKSPDEEQGAYDGIPIKG